MADSELIVRLRGENSDLKSKLTEVTNASKTSASSMASNFKSSLGTIAAAIGVTFSVAAVINFGKQSVMAFAETERAAVSLKNVISNMGGSDAQGSGMVSMADSLERMSGFDDADIMGALQELTVQTGSGAKASEALAVAMNVAAARGINLKEAGNQVFMVMSGLSRSMRQFGMATRDGATDMDYLRELGTKMTGGLSTNLDTLSGRLRITTNAFDNLKEAIGSTLAASVTAGGGMIANLLNGLSGVISTNAVFATMFGTAIGDKERSLMQRLGNQYGQAWLNGYADTLSGNTTEHDVGWAASMVSPTGFGNPEPDVVGAGTGMDDILAGNADIAHKIYDLRHNETQQAIYEIGLQSAEWKKAGYDKVAIANWVALATKDANKASWAEAWKPISMMGGNLPELTKFIGNLRQANTIKLAVEVDIKGTGAKVSATDAKKIAAAVAPVVAAAITHGQGWTPRTAGGMGGGNAQ